MRPSAASSVYKGQRRRIKIGRQNPQYYEVTEGLEPGEKVIVSGYESYKDSEVLILAKWTVKNGEPKTVLPVCMKNF